MPPQSVYYQLKTAPDAFRTVPRFYSRYWTANGPTTCFPAAVTDGTGAGVTFYAEMNMQGDLPQYTWFSQDKISHPSLAYSTNKDYSGITWSFSYASTSNILYSFTSGSTTPTLAVIYKSATIQSPAIAGTNIIFVDSTDNMQAGDTLGIGGGSTGEDIKIQSISGLQITLVSNLAHNHSIGEQVQASAFINLTNYAQVGYTSYAATIVINWDTVHSGFSSLSPDWTPVRSTNIEQLVFSIAPTSYSPTSGLPISGGPVQANIALSNFTVTSNVGTSPNAIMSVGVPPTVNGQQVINDVGLAVANDYSTVYNITPERNVEDLQALGYRAGVGHYVGAKSYFSLVWSSGQNSLIVDNTKTLNYSFSAWHTDYFNRLTAYSMPFTISLSLEIYTPFQPNFWDQQNWAGQSAHTGYTPSTTLARFMRSDTRAFLISIFQALVNLTSPSANVTIQAGEVAWWLGQFGNNQGVFIFDIDTKNAYNAATGLFAPEIDLPASSFESLNGAQQAYVIWCSQQLSLYTDAVKAAVQAIRPGILFSVLWFSDAILLNSFNSTLNLPKSGWQYGRGYILDNENYGDVTPNFIPANLNTLFRLNTGPIAQGNLGYPLNLIRYYVGVASDPTGAIAIPAYWAPIVAAINYAVAQQWGTVIVWAYAQIVQTGVVFLPQIVGSLALVDETGSNPLPPGVLVSVVDPWGDPVGSAYTTAGGLAAVSVQPGFPYTMTLKGTQVKGVPMQTFQGTSPPTLVTVAPYRSPCLSASGYTKKQMEALPTEDFPPAAKVAGGVTYNIASGFSAGMADIDAQQQVALGANRLVSSTGSALDTWAQDFIGLNVWPRGSNESDQFYLARIILWLQTRKGTLQGIQTLIQAYVAATINLGNLDQIFALDVGGALDIAGGLDSRGGAALAQVMPRITCFDYQSDAKLSAAVGLVVDQAQFAVLFSYPNATPPALWYLGSAHLGVDTFLGSPAYYITSAPTPDIDALVQVIKRVGTKPIYVSNKPAM